MKKYQPQLRKLFLRFAAADNDVASGALGWVMMGVAGVWASCGCAARGPMARPRARGIGC